MKKILIALVAALVMGGAMFAENHTFGLDLTWALGLGTNITTEKESKGNVSVEYKTNTFEFAFAPLLPLRLAGYECFAVNNHIGVFVSFSAAGALGREKETKWKKTIGGVTEEGSSKDDPDDFRDLTFGVRTDFIIGPAFGFDLGESSIRFQTGVGFHLSAGRYWTIGDSKNDVDFASIKMTSFGLGLTPQFRFGASKRVSFVLGADFIFDFGERVKYMFKESSSDFYSSSSGSSSSSKKDDKLKYDKAFRFMCMPYIGLGINFGH